MEKNKFDIKNIFEQSLIVFPLLIAGFSLALIFKAVQTLDIQFFFWAFMLPYILPLLCFKIINTFSPLKKGIAFIGSEGYSPWLGAYKLQLIYLYFPFLEKMLRMVPGLFSIWLRMWGSKIGRGVYWTPEITILDRTHLKIGNNIIFGHAVQMTSHAIKPKNGKIFLYLNDITIGDHCLIGAWCRIAPGVKIPAGSIVKVGTDLYPNEEAKND